MPQAPTACTKRPASRFRTEFIDKLAANRRAEHAHDAYGQNIQAARADRRAHDEFGDFGDDCHGDNDAAHKETHHHGDDDGLIAEVFQMEHRAFRAAFRQHKRSE